jgi:hypothetical protein
LGIPFEAGALAGERFRRGNFWLRGGATVVSAALSPHALKRGFSTT